MKYAIHINALSSVYQDSTEKSKQTSQLLFGELCIIKSERDDFYYIENYIDKHCGWVLQSSFYPIDNKEADNIKSQDLLRVCMPLVDVFDLKNKTVLRLPAGSIIPNYKPELSKFNIGDSEYQIHSSFITHLPYGNLDAILEIALIFQNVPFMFGGKSVLGIDKTGFVQLIFNLCGYSMPRGGQDQVKIGVPVYSDKQLRKGDLIFIEENNLVTDVYIYLVDDKIIGVDGNVKIMSLEKSDIITRNCIIRRLV